MAETIENKILKEISYFRNHDKPLFQHGVWINLNGMTHRLPAKKKLASLNDDTFGWIGLALVMIAAVVLDKKGQTNKWHAAIMWTFVALLCLLVFGRGKRSSWLFWVFWATCLVLHIVVMWAIFGELLPRLVLGTVYVVPLAYVESLFLLLIFYKLERMSARRH